MKSTILWTSKKELYNFENLSFNSQFKNNNILIEKVSFFLFFKTKDFRRLRKKNNRPVFEKKKSDDLKLPICSGF